VKGHEKKIIKRARRTLELEARAIEGLIPRLGGSFLKAVELLHDCRGKVVLTGVGKSGLVAKKIAATLSSTGTPALFVHSAEAAHGDLGAITPEDVVLAVSTSGETEEIKQLIPSLGKVGVKIIALTRKRTSSLAAVSDVALLTGRIKEACPLGLAPTTSAIASMALGDALATALLERRGFGEEDFARLHPGGALGKKWLRVDELMHRGDELPLVKKNTPLFEAVCVMSSKKLGVAGVVDGRGRLKGIITDGDLRRMIETRIDFASTPVQEVMTPDPQCIGERELGVQALRLMESRTITSLMVTSPGGRLVGLIHMHDLLRAGIA
jgi:arabinose-5-phosphate isomerase